MNRVFGDNVREGDGFDAGATAAATTGAVSDVPEVESSAHPSPTAAAPRNIAHKNLCCVISSLPYGCRRWRVTRIRLARLLSPPSSLSAPRSRTDEPGHTLSKLHAASGTLEATPIWVKSPSVACVGRRPGCPRTVSDQ